MKAIVRTKEHGEDMNCISIPIPIPKKGEVLVKIMCSPLNPSDKFAALGFYGLPPYKPLPPTQFISGLEGSGIITSVGEGVSQDLINKKVGVFCETLKFQSYHGNWSQYSIKRVDDVYVFPDQNIGFEETSSLFVNPMTVMLMWKEIEEGNHKAVIQTGATGSLGKMLYKLCHFKKIPIINVVHKEENVKHYKEVIKAEYVLDSLSPNFQKELEEIIAKLKPTVAFDAVAGDLTSTILHAMPMYSQYFIYGGLSGKATNNINCPDEFLIMRKQLKGIWLSEQLPSLDRALYKKYMDFIFEDIKNKDSIFRPVIIKRFKLEDWKDAFENFQKCATQGKYVFIPNDS